MWTWWTTLSLLLECVAASSGGAVEPELGFDPAVRACWPVALGVLYDRLECVPSDVDPDSHFEWVFGDAPGAVGVASIVCSSGAYNELRLLVRPPAIPGASWRPVPLRSYASPDAPPAPLLLANLDWSPAESLLDATMKYRGLGDCGRSSRYLFDVERGSFCLAECREQPECEGRLPPWPTTWSDAGCAR